MPDAGIKQITLRYSEALVREAVRAFVTRSITVLKCRPIICTGKN